jgi:hypothetical protein
MIRKAWETNKPLALVGLAMIAILAVALVGLVVDPRVITGAPAWLKPAKFAISIAVYSFTLIWLLRFVAGRPRLVRLLSWLTAVTLGLEMVLIGGAAAAGTTSHFNVSSPLHIAIWSTMASAIVGTWMANLVVAFLLLRQRFADPAFAWALRLGVLISAVGMGVAFFMTSPTSTQLDAARSGAGMAVAGAHTVGAPDGGPGLPVLGWSTVGGDLRAAHFFGLHALQVLPLVWFLLTRFGPGRLRPADRAGLIWTFGLSYLAFVVLLTAQALRGQPLVKPDGVTLGMLAGIVLAATTATIVILRNHSELSPVPHSARS